MKKFIPYLMAVFIFGSIPQIHASDLGPMTEQETHLAQARAFCLEAGLSQEDTETQLQIVRNNFQSQPNGSNVGAPADLESAPVNAFARVISNVPQQAILQTTQSNLIDLTQVKNNPQFKAEFFKLFCTELKAISDEYHCARQEYALAHYLNNQPEERLYNFNEWKNYTKAGTQVSKYTKETTRILGANSFFNVEAIGTLIAASKAQRFNTPDEITQLKRFAIPMFTNFYHATGKEISEIKDFFHLLTP